MVTPPNKLREEWAALASATTLHLLPQQALIATIKDLASQLLTLTAREFGEPTHEPDNPRGVWCCQEHCDEFGMPS